MSEILLSTNNLTKTYNKRNVVENVSLTIPKGSVYGLIGRNGAGKTTIMKMLSGMSKPSAGSFSYEGFKGGEQEAFGKIGSLIETPAFIPNLSAHDNLKLKCIAYGVNKNVESHIGELLTLVGLGNVGSKHVGKFSLGMKQRLGIAMAMVGNPELLLLDEPINGLDPQGIAEVRNMITKLNSEKGITVIISSHILEELSKVMTDYAIIERGHIVEEETSANLHHKCRESVVIKSGDIDSVINALNAAQITTYSIDSAGLIRVDGYLEKPDELNRILVTNGASISSLYIAETDLEEYFLRTISKVRK